MCSSACFISREMLGILVSLVTWNVGWYAEHDRHIAGDTHIPSDISRGYTKHGDTHITVTPEARNPVVVGVYLHFYISLL